MSISSVNISFDVQQIISDFNKSKEKTYESVHVWLRKVYGFANKCENQGCVNPSLKFQWAKVKGKEYDYKRENFVMLCGRCHYYYDEKHKEPRRKKKHE